MLKGLRYRYYKHSRCFDITKINQVVPEVVLVTALGVELIASINLFRYEDFLIKFVQWNHSQAFDGSGRIIRSILKHSI